MATENIGATLPKEVVNIAKEEAKARGITFSALVNLSLCSFLGLDVSQQKWGGDRSKYKSAETHARVCERMREAKEAKRTGVSLSKTEEERIKRLAVAEAEKIILERKRDELSPEKKSKIYWEVRKFAESQKQSINKKAHDGRASH